MQMSSQMKSVSQPLKCLLSLSNWGEPPCSPMDTFTEPEAYPTQSSGGLMKLRFVGTIHYHTLVPTGG